MKNESDLETGELTILEDYARDKFKRLLKFFNRIDSNTEIEDIIFLELVYNEPRNSIYILCYWAICPEPTAYIINSNLFKEICPYEINLTWNSVCKIDITLIKENSSPSGEFIFIPQFNSLCDAIQNLKKTEIEFVTNNEFLRKAKKIINVELRAEKIKKLKILE